VPAERRDPRRAGSDVVMTAPARRRVSLLVLTAAAFAIALLGPAGGPPGARAAAYDRFYSDFQGEEVMLVTNADRAALGLPAFAADPALIALARDQPMACPSDATLAIRGRVRDMAERGYLSHTGAGLPGTASPVPGRLERAIRHARTPGEHGRRDPHARPLAVGGSDGRGSHGD